MLENFNTFKTMLRRECRKRKYIYEEEGLPEIKRIRKSPWMSRRFEQKCREYHERKRKNILGLILYLDAQQRDVRRLNRKRTSSEFYSEYEGFLRTKYARLAPQKVEAQISVKATAATAGVVPALPNTTVTTRVIEGELEQTNKIKAELQATVKKRKITFRLSDNGYKSEASDVNVTSDRR